MPGNKKIVAIFSAVLGCTFIGVYFYSIANSKVINLLYQQVPKTEIMALAEQAYNNSECVYEGMRKEVNVNLDDNLLQYAQRFLKAKNDKNFLPTGQWKIAWNGKIKSKKEGTQKVGFTVTYDVQGNLIGMEQSAPDLNRPPNFKESEALAEATTFLQSLNVDTTAIVLRNKIINKDERVLHYDFAFSKPSSVSNDLKENYDVKITGRNITYYRARTILDREHFAFPAIDKTSEIVAIVLMLVVWVLITIFLIGIFFKRLKHDELEFKRAIWLGVASLLIMWVYMAIANWPAWQEILLGGGFTSLFTGLAIVFAYAVTDSLNRDVWQQKMALTDVLLRGFFRVKEFGLAILNALFISGVSLLMFAGLFWLTSHLNFGYFEFDKEALRIFKGNYAIISAIFKNIISNLLIGLILFSLWTTYLRSKLQNKVSLIIVSGLFINFAGLQLYYLRPTYISFFLFLPLAFFGAYWTFKHEFITVLLSLFIVNLFIEFSLLSLLPHGLFSAPGLFVGIFTFFMLVSGVYFINSKLSLKDFEHYVPEYVSRIAEREKFLKELEIARSVQMRFLPQTLPEFPNLDIASICRPAMEVGGDYYDFILNGDKSLGVVIGDVSGKGVSAAFYMTMVKGIIKTLTKSTRAPKQILTDMNTIFYENAPNEVFISMIYGLFDMQNKTLTFARAGHNPIIFRKSKGSEAELLQSKGLAIGLEKGHLFPNIIEEVSLAIEPGDIFIFFTDGISESMNKNGDEFGEDRLRYIVRQNSQCSAQALLDTITQEVTLFSDKATQHDDFTMVVVKAGG
ncbi:MAG: PP2C family protein-serine/threonine phosphatase [bacterium]